MPTLNRAPPIGRGYYVESANMHPLLMTKLGHFTAHIYCLRTIMGRGGQAAMAEQ